MKKAMLIFDPAHGIDVPERVTTLNRLNKWVDYVVTNPWKVLTIGSIILSIFLIAANVMYHALGKLI